MPRHALVALSLSLAAAPAWAEAPARGGPGGISLSPPGSYELLPPSSALLGASQGAEGSGARSILTSALYGGLAGALIGVGVALIEGDHWGRNLAIGAGAGVLVGAAFGVSRALSARTPVSDGLHATDRWPVLRTPSLGVLGGRF